MKKVDLISDQIIIKNLSNPEVYGEFIQALKQCLENGYNRPVLIVSDAISIYPNVACPIAGLIKYYNSLGIKFKTSSVGKAANSICLTSPLQIGSERASHQTTFLNKVWEFKKEEDVFNLSNAFIDELTKTDQFEKGVLHSLEWSLYEIMDNVINHSETESGFVMGQIHLKSKHIALCVFDAGQGIFNSLQTYHPKPKTPLDALTICIKPGVTRGFGQGNGLFGLYEVVRQNEGTFSISSAGASLRFKDNNVQTSYNNPYVSDKIGCTTVDFQLNYKKPISLGEALQTTGRTYPPVNYRIENLENESGEIIFLLKEKSSGFGTRKAGQKMRNEVLNIHHETGQSVVIDFDGIALVASSFADEFLGKLVLELGFFGFNKVIRLRNMSELTQSIVQKSVSQRMAESLKQ
ncbi:MAG: STAS-like domain-containing protein [Saprospiraceae bacterium]|nr:STAS-like domain-containing protein [Saprospiraceae bacterium]